MFMRFLGLALAYSVPDATIELQSLVISAPVQAVGSNTKFKKVCYSYAPPNPANLRELIGIIVARLNEIGIIQGLFE